MAVLPLPPHHSLPVGLHRELCTSTAASPEDARSWQQGELPGEVFKHAGCVTPRDSCPLQATSACSVSAHTSVPQVKSSQIAAMQSPLLFLRLFLGFGPHLVQQTPRNPFERVSKRNRLASHRAPCSLLFGMSLQHPPVPCATTCPCSAQVAQEEVGCFGESGFTPQGPTGPFILFCKRLRAVVCYLPFSTAGISLLRQTVF